MRALAAGERVSIDTATIEIDVTGPRLDSLPGELGAVLVALDSDRRVPAAFAPVDGGTRELRPGATFDGNGVLQIEFAALPPAVDRLLLVLYISRGFGAGITFRDFGSLSASVGDFRFALDLANRADAALIMVEIYRRGTGWRLSASGQGFVGGMGALGHALGVSLRVPETSPTPGNGNGADRGRSRAGTSFSGSGFAVDRRHVLTNAHVIDGARTIKISGEAVTAPAEIVLSDPRNDIALLRTEQDLRGFARFRDQYDIHLGEDVVVVGFPLQGLLGSGPTATAGNISALCGIGNDTSILQFSAPIASGNSGGPLLDQSGLVIGLVHASLNLDRIRQAGNNAENINFGVKGAMVRAFLATAGITPSLAADGKTRGRADIVRDARGYIYRINCEG